MQQDKAQKAMYILGETYCVYTDAKARLKHTYAL